MLTSHVFGLGIFSGDRPVLYLPIVKSQAMIDLHNQIWERLGSLADRANGYYSPAFWLPHITLAINDLRRENLACALESVAFEPVELTISVDNLILVVQKGNPSSTVPVSSLTRGGIDESRCVGWWCGGRKTCAWVGCFAFSRLN
jgi:2'-5' RNA ligase